MTKCQTKRNKTEMSNKNLSPNKEREERDEQRDLNSVAYQPELEKKVRNPQILNKLH